MIGIHGRAWHIVYVSIAVHGILCMYLLLCMAYRVCIYCCAWHTMYVSIAVYGIPCMYQPPSYAS